MNLLVAGDTGPLNSKLHISLTASEREGHAREYRSGFAGAVAAEYRSLTKRSINL
jgi:hypothetical protein